MFRNSLGLALLLLATSPIHADPPCPRLSVKVTPLQVGKAVVAVEVAPPDSAAAFVWTISGGSIASGQGTARIEIEGSPDELLVVTVTVVNLPTGCPQTSSEIVDLSQKPD